MKKLYFLTIRIIKMKKKIFLQQILLQNLQQLYLVKLKILKIEDGDQKFLFDGYKIYATMDLDIQRAAYKSFNSNYNLRNNQKLNGALISIDPSNGFVKAMVGGKNYKKGTLIDRLMA